RPTEIAPFAAVTRASPVTAPIQVSPLEFLIAAGPSILPTRMTPAGLPPAPLGSWAGPASSNASRPAPLRSRHSPSRPVDCTEATPVVPRRDEPAGSSIRTSIDPSPPRNPHLH